MTADELGEIHSTLSHDVTNFNNFYEFTQNKEDCGSVS